jgi:hypothetical protein
MNAEGDALDQELVAASRTLNRAGVRLMTIDAQATVGIWADLDSAELRQALRLLGLGRAPVRYLDGSGVPMRYKATKLEGEPIPLNVLAEMERSISDEPWMIRDRMLREIRWHSRPIPWPLNSRGVASRTKTPLDPETGILPISEWGPECGRGLGRDRPQSYESWNARKRRIEDD